MTAEENIGIAARTGKAFKFLRTRTVNNVTTTAEFFPGAGSRLRFANRAADTLTLSGMPVDTVKSGDTVTVQYNGSGSWVTVFVGDVDRIVERRGRGMERVVDVTCTGPWSKLNRLVFRQVWDLVGRGTNGATLSIWSTRVILNQTAAGAAQTMKQQLGEILTLATDYCGISYSAADVTVPDLCLPADEARDITCADAIRRELRFFPKLIVRFDYSSGTPAIKIAEPSSTDASYVASVPKAERVYEYDANPIRCVDVAVDTTDIVIGGASASTHQVYPANGNTYGLDCLHVTVPLARGSSSTTNESFESVTEDIPSNIATNAGWWKQKHPRLANVVLEKITITNGTRSPSNYPRIAKSTKGEIEAAGLHCEVSRFTCDCKIATDDDEEENIKLTMDFLTTDARTKTYTWQTGSSSTAGETLPAGLAQALYEQRSQSLVNERMTIRLGATWPQLGDAVDGIYLQSFEVDVYDLTAQLSFGRPEHLSAEDLASLLNGFRQRGYSTTAKLRKEKADEHADEADAPGGIPPISSSEWSPGTKVKTTLKKTSGGGTVSIDASSAGTINLKTTDVGSGKTAQFRDLTYTDSNGQQQTVKVLMTEAATIPAPPSSPSTSTCDVVTGLTFGWNAGRLYAHLNKKTVTVVGTPASATGENVYIDLWKQTIVTGSQYDSSEHRFKNQTLTGVRAQESNGTTDSQVFEAAAHSAE